MELIYSDAHGITKWLISTLLDFFLLIAIHTFYDDDLFPECREDGANMPMMLHQLSASS